MKTDFVCPKCRGALVCDANVKRCSAGHTFDRARAGYYNLLLGSSGGAHGDNRMMVEARRKFLSGGYYQPLAERIAELVCGAVADARDGASGGDAGTLPTVLDCGCGEGYYTEIVCSVLNKACGAGGCSMLAFDISRDAAKLAAKRCRTASVAVASCYDMPVSDGSVDVAMNVFSPLAPDEVLRVLRPNGCYIVAYPDEDHLFDLKAAIYDKPYKNQPQGRAPDGFSLKSREKIAYEITLEDGGSIESLFLMTPYAYRTGKKERERLEKLTELTTRVEFLIDIYEKQG